MYLGWIVGLVSGGYFASNHHVASRCLTVMASGQEVVELGTEGIGSIATAVERHTTNQNRKETEHPRR